MDVPQAPESTADVAASPATREPAIGQCLRTALRHQMELRGVAERTASTPQLSFDLQRNSYIKNVVRQQPSSAIVAVSRVLWEARNEHY